MRPFPWFFVDRLSFFSASRRLDFCGSEAVPIVIADPAALPLPFFTGQLEVPIAHSALHFDLPEDKLAPPTGCFNPAPDRLHRLAR